MLPAWSSHLEQALLKCLEFHVYPLPFCGFELQRVNSSGASMKRSRYPSEPAERRGEH